MPYTYKKKVLQAVIISSLLYGSESWFEAKLKMLEQMYYGALKALLGVRETTRTDVILLETGMPTVKELISMRTIAFVKKNVRADKDSTPLAKAFKMCEDKGTSGYRYSGSRTEIITFCSHAVKNFGSKTQYGRDSNALGISLNEVELYHKS